MEMSEQEQIDDLRQSLVELTRVVAEIHMAIMTSEMLVQYRKQNESDG